MAGTGKNIRKTIIIGPQCHEYVLPLSSRAFGYLREHGIRWVGMSNLKGEYEVHRDRNNAHLIHYTLAGRGWLRTEGFETVLKPGDMWLSPDGTWQEYGLDGDIWDILWFDLLDQPPWSVLREYGTVVRQSVLGKNFRRVLNLLLWEVQAGGLHSPSVIQLLSEVILYYLERELDVQASVGDYVVVNQLHKLFNKVNSRVREKWDVERLADESGLYVSPDHFARLCVRHLGVPPMRMVTQIRMDKARELLRSTAYPLKNIARLVGYENYFAFSNAFKRWTGDSPREFRQQRRKT